jgi:hypothetical protein
VRGNVLESKTIVSQFPKVIPEHLLVEIPEEMEWLYADIGAFQLALEQTPKVFESVGVNLSVNVSFSVVNNLVLETLLLESLIGHERIGIDRAARFDVSANVGLQSVLFAIPHYGGANLAATFQNAHDGGFVFGASFSNPALVFVGVHESGCTANESFVHFHFTSATAEFHKRASLHRKPDAVKHEPCGLLSDAKSAGHFVGTDSVLTICDHPNCDEPLVEWQSGIFHDGSDFDGELPVVMDVLALPLPLIFKEHGILTATGGANDNTIRPAELNHECEAVVGICEVNDCLLKSFWLGFHGVPHKPNVAKAV